MGKFVNNQVRFLFYPHTFVIAKRFIFFVYSEFLG